MKKTVTIIISLLIIIGIMVVGLLSIIDEKQTISGDSLKFKEEYELLNGKYDEENNKTVLTMEIAKDNPMIYINDNEIIKKLTEGTQIIYFGNPECEWSRRIVPVLLRFAKTNLINTIYYYNVYNLKAEYEKGINKEKVKLYESIIDILNQELKTTDENNMLLAPTVFFIKDGTIVGSHYKLIESYTDTNEELTKEQTEELIKIYQSHYDKMFANICIEEDC